MRQGGVTILVLSTIFMNAIIKQCNSRTKHYILDTKIYKEFT